MPADPWMSRALDLAERGRGHVEPNPLVGAVVVRDGVLAGEGWHERFGGPHAEVNAIAAAGDAARGATLYVTLEPCCHHGKTPPCTDAIIAAGIRRVVAAMRDPFAQVAGKGIETLRAAGVEVEVGCEEGAAAYLNHPYRTLLRAGRPYVHAKWAMTLDGKIATRTKHSKWISCETSREFVHRLRGRMDAIVVGRGTVLADDPLLTARPPGPRVATRIVLASAGGIPADCRLRTTVDQAPLLVVTLPEWGFSLKEKGCDVLEIPPEGEGHRPSVTALLQELGRRRMTNILVEGGSDVFFSFFEAQLVDELHVFIAPRIVGGRTAPSPIGGIGFDKIFSCGRPMIRWAHSMSGQDLYINAIFLGDQAIPMPSDDEPA
jgi:diaminohydroxyphosphoribosylaminopyrimidine deaminase/5-amino-6-(5-phosphoribosylamino)uracil reductase